MRRPILGLAAAIFLICFSSTALADWTVARATGTVWLIAPDSSSHPITVGQSFPNAWMIATGSDGRVMLTRGAEVISVSPGTQMVLTDEGPNTQVWQPVGAIDFDIEHRNVQHFTVQTPLLAAVVKGTRFSVVSGNGRAEVHVENGAVEVRAGATGETAMVLTGQAAALNAGGTTLEMTGAVVPPTAATARPAGAGETGNPAVLDVVGGLVVAANLPPQETPPQQPAAGQPPLPDAPAPAESSGSSSSAGGPAEDHDCRHGGWEDFGFPDERACRDYVEGIENPPPAAGEMPTNEEQCKHHGWEAYGFVDERACKEYVKALT